MPSNSPLSPASTDLNLGGQLADQVEGETDEARKKRLAQMQQQQQLGPAGSMAVTSLFGMNAGARGAGY